jgi:hypothetical protein
MLRDSVAGPKGAFEKVATVLLSLPSAATDLSDTQQTGSSGKASGGIAYETLVNVIDPAFIVEPA